MPIQQIEEEGSIGCNVMTIITHVRFSGRGIPLEPPMCSATSETQTCLPAPEGSYF
jgi:hypothetical protein